MFQELKFSNIDSDEYFSIFTTSSLSQFFIGAFVKTYNLTAPNYNTNNSNKKYAILVKIRNLFDNPKICMNRDEYTIFNILVK